MKDKYIGKFCSYTSDPYDYGVSNSLGIILGYNGVYTGYDIFWFYVVQYGSLESYTDTCDLKNLNIIEQ
mgnify:CR=1 FL=1